MISVVILLFVFSLIAVRQIGKIKLEIWQVMTFGALACLITGQISPIEALRSINLDVILFLFGMFVVGVGLEESGYLSHISYKIFKRAKSPDELLFLILYVIGIASAFLMNDTLAIIGTPVVLHLSRKHQTSPKLLLLTLAFAVTIGSVMSPIGNPQNLLIALEGSIKNPFVLFFKFLLVPTMINLAIAFFVLRFFYKESFHNNSLNHSQEPIKNKNLAKLSKGSLFLIVGMVLLKISIVTAGIDIDFRLTYISLIASMPILIFAKQRRQILKNVDWKTLIFFVSMFVLMRSVWDSGFIQSVINSMEINITSLSMILVVSIVLSQFISNVPLVALYLPMLLEAGASSREMVALAAGSTIAGNLFILGAASTVIIIQNAEKKSGETITFIEFARIGIPLTILNTVVYYIYLSLF
ncbi:MAG: Citrate transporter [Candidatus Methanofastidiosum methylothiophilum]|uniref:Citrate transporter n=1 Tax=Candidatus Methanofastidiosum methylothiophilum TaxID=1705564 RepID=A0A150IR91_9EURY|nr:MAG: Citrate transporter [Candidatus Methanofastidiosum methylthiophilus]KYC47486.1 MAG: Citrate transporter [Candidatus Methanofastidiosum methylthiophilus]KYC50386.1 MAG: Citrate transporter [Candidatus Methanofastidiosum methylthiophilus]